MLERADTLERLADHVARHGADEQAVAAAERVRRYFNEAAPHHHADEENDLFPRLRAACPEDRTLHAELEALAAAHSELEAAWARLDAALGQVVERQPAVLEPAAFVAALRDHVAREDEAIAPRLRSALSAADLREAGRAMAARRGRESPT